MKFCKWVNGIGRKRYEVIATYQDGIKEEGDFIGVFSKTNDGNIDGARGSEIGELFDGVSVRLFEVSVSSKGSMDC